MKKIFLSALFILISLQASAKQWETVLQNSKIEFQAIQNGVPIVGGFKNFKADINFDPQNLAQSKVYVEIDTTSLEVSLADAVSTLKTAAWLSTKAFPKAIFEADKFTKISTKSYTAGGKLTIKGVSMPVMLEFSLDEFLPKKAIASGKATIKRSDFEVGPKEEKNAHGVKDEILVNFVIEAAR